MGSIQRRDALTTNRTLYLSVAMLARTTDAGFRRGGYCGVAAKHVTQVGERTLLSEHTRGARQGDTLATLDHGTTRDFPPAGSL